MLAIRGVSKSFGALRALKNVSFDIQKNRVHGIIGPNGSGKTTLFNCITGHLASEEGTIQLESELLTGLKPHVMAGSYRFRSGDLLDIFLRLPFRRSTIEQEIEEAARAALALVDMEEEADRWAVDLVWAERQFVQIASRPESN
jgi:ABC-type branched-subunit amino acid transport system ATPase component